MKSRNLLFFIFAFRLSRLGFFEKAIDFGMRLFLVTILPFVFVSKSFAEPEKPLVLQYTVSHVRNVDHISLVFRQNSVELVVNTSSWQEAKNPRLGHFESPLTPELSLVKMQAQLAHESLSQNVPLSSLLNLPPQIPDPHAPVVWLGGKEIKESSSYFEPMTRILQQAWESANWDCLKCARYKKRRNQIVRTVSRVVGSKKTAKTEKKVFSQKELDCVSSQYSAKMECVDPEFGIFEL